MASKHHTAPLMPHLIPYIEFVYHNVIHIVSYKIFKILELSGEFIDIGWYLPHYPYENIYIPSMHYHTVMELVIPPAFRATVYMEGMDSSLSIGTPITVYSWQHVVSYYINLIQQLVHG